jgi:indolepyruvate ferredoxin oxidoreductase
VDKVKATESALVGPGAPLRLTAAVARAYAKLLAYKDEYEVARLYTEPAFWDALESTFEGAYTVRFHLAPPFLSRPDPETGRITKRIYGAGMMRIFRLLARLKGLRGTRWDPFGRSADRRLERELIRQYEADVAELLGNLSFLRLPLALEIARLPEEIRGYGHIKARNAAAVAEKRAALLASWREPAPLTSQAA